ncbi:uncharacterized protein VP01_4279g1 [Puccinia sorghi]|uniref:Uncharacterized protein n=1 Tax=Puccinia sorghi TaxID=27349 RepID=A0A0L6UQ89_9BASI|nr:uncharacterized protein VP01_4279g1 [Puccinia sorghi]
MTSNNVKLYITEMGGFAEKLNSLITSDNPLTADNVYSAALLISLPPDWINCVSSLMNEKRMPSAQIFSALKQKSLSHKAHLEETNPISVSSVKPKPGSQSQRKSNFCMFCKLPRHYLLNCKNASQVLQKYKTRHDEDYLACKPNSSKGSASKSKTPAKAGHTTVIDLGDYSPNNDFYSELSEGYKDKIATYLLFPNCCFFRIFPFPQFHVKT